jgi:hypothetical protein
MKRFDKSAEVFAAGYALPWYSVEHKTRAWRYKDHIFTTPVDASVERVHFVGGPVDALHMESYKHEPL